MRRWNESARFALFGLGFALLKTTGLAAQAAGVVRGHVTEQGTGAAVRGAVVTVYSSNGSTVRAVEADDEGAYTVVELAEGTYTIEAGRIGYGIVSRAGAVVIPGTTLVIDLALPIVALEAEGIVVAGTRRAERVVESDAAVTGVRGDRVIERAEPTVFGALRGVRGLDAFSSGLGQQQVNARGFVNPFASNMLFLVDYRLSTLPGLGTILPGLVLAAQEDVSRIDVVTGPTSALYGANAGNGVISVITREPGDGWTRSVSAYGGERSSLRAAVRLAGPVVSRVSFKATAEMQQAADFERINTFSMTDGYTFQDRPDFTIRNRSVSGSIYYDAAPGTRLVFSAGTTRSSYVNLTVVSRLQVRDWDASYQQARVHFTDVAGLGSLFVQGYYTRNDAGRSYYLDILARSLVPQVHGGPGLTEDAAMQRARFIDRSDRFDLELQQNRQFGTAHTITSGMQWRRSRPNSGGTYLTDGPADDPIRIGEWGGYIGYENRSLADVRFTAIGRFDHHSDFGDRFSPRLTVSWGFRPDHTLRLGFNQAFNSPTTYLLYARSFTGRTPEGLPVMVRGNRGGYRFVNESGGPVPAPLARLDPLSIRSWEAGWRGVLARRVFVDVAVYRSTYANYISKETAISRPADGIFAIDPTTGQVLRELTRTYLNYGELPTTGAELGVQWLPLDVLGLNAGFSWQRPGEFKSPLNGLDPPGFNAPERKFTAGAQWFGWWRAGTTAELSMTRVDDFLFVSSLPYLTGRVPDYTVADITAGIPVQVPGVGDGRLLLAVRNLTNRHHFETPGGARLGRVASVGVRMGW